MGTIVSFPLSGLSGKVAVPPLSRAALRIQLEEAANDVLDVADRILAALDRIGEDADRVDGKNADPNLGLPKGTDR